MTPSVRLFSVCAVILAFGLLAAAQEKVDADKLPAKVKAALDARFPGAMITQITKENENNVVLYDIEMTWKGKKHEMDCHEDGIVKDIPNEIPVQDLPAVVVEAVKKKYPGCKLKEAGEILLVNCKTESRDHFEVFIDTTDNRRRTVDFAQH